MPLSIHATHVEHINAFWWLFVWIIHCFCKMLLFRFGPIWFIMKTVSGNVVENCEHVNFADLYGWRLVLRFGLMLLYSFFLAKFRLIILLLSIIIVKIRLTRSQLPTCFIERGSNSTATGCVSYYDMRCEHQNNGYNRRKKEEKMCTNSNQLCYISIYLNANINIICRQMKQLLRR